MIGRDVQPPKNVDTVDGRGGQREVVRAAHPARDNNRGGTRQQDDNLLAELSVPSTVSRGQKTFPRRAFLRLHVHLAHRVPGAVHGHVQFRAKHVLVYLGVDPRRDEDAVGLFHTLY